MPNDLQSDLSRLVARIEREDAPLARPPTRTGRIFTLPRRSAG